MGLKNYINQYIRSIGNNKSLNTQRAYRESLSKFLEFAGDIQPEQISEDLINVKFRSYLSGDLGLSPLTTAYSLQHIRYLLEFLEKQSIPSLAANKVIDKKLMQELKPNTRKYEGDVVTDEEEKKKVSGTFFR